MAFDAGFLGFFHHRNNALELNLIGRGANGVLNLHHQGFVIGGEGGRAVKLVVLPCLIATANMAALLGCFVDDHAVGADKAVNERLDGNQAKADFRIGDADARLYEVAGDNFSFKPCVHALDVHLGIRDLAGFDMQTVNVGQNRHDRFGNLVVVDAAVALAEKRTAAAIKGAEHADGGFVGKPVIHILCQQIRRTVGHLTEVVDGDACVRSNLLTADIVEVHASGEVIDNELRLIVNDFHFHLAGIDQVVFLGLVLTVKLLCEFEKGLSCFHFRFLQIYHLLSSCISLKTMYKAAVAKSATTSQNGACLARASITIMVKMKPATIRKQITEKMMRSSIAEFLHSGVQSLYEHKSVVDVPHDNPLIFFIQSTVAGKRNSEPLNHVVLVVSHANLDCVIVIIAGHNACTLPHDAVIVFFALAVQFVAKVACKLF